MMYSIVIPVYNEKDNIEVLYRRLEQIIKELSKETEIIFVDDGSVDGSVDILNRIAMNDERVVFVEFDRNYGQHPAVVAGLVEARGEYIVTLDADLQNPPEEIPVLLKEMEIGGYDMVSGRRKKRKDSIFRKIPSFFTNLIISTLTGVWMEDYGSMLRVFRSGTAKKLAQIFSERPAYITMLIPLVTKNVREVDVQHDERLSGESKYGLMRLLEAFVRIFITRKHKSGKPVENLYSIKTIIRDRCIVKSREVLG